MNEAKNFKDYVNSYDDNYNVHYIILNYIMSEYSLTDMLELVQTIIHKVSNSLTKILGAIRIDEIEAEKVEIVKHGQWIIKNNRGYCSECNQSYDVLGGTIFNYCPNCGTKMTDF